MTTTVPAVPRRRRLCLVALSLAVVAGGAAAPTASAGADGQPAADPVHIDDGAAPSNPMDPALLPDSFDTGAGAKGVEALRPDGSSGFRPFASRSIDFGAYRFQLVSSGADGDIEQLRPAIVETARQLSVVTGITFSVDAGQVPRPSSVNRFPARQCGSFPGHQCSYFDDAETEVGIIRVGFSAGSPCGPLVPVDQEEGTVGCGGPESVTDNGTIVHLRGNVWLSPSLRGANASIAGDVVSHEVAHAMGLDHYAPAYTATPGSAPVRQLMFPAVHGDPTDSGLVYRTGDMQGLRWLHPGQAWFISATYLDFLGRVPDTAGYAFWALADVTPEEYVNSLATSGEWVGRIVSDFYQDVFGRAPDPGGFAFWSQQVRTRGVPYVASQLYGSQEYFIRNGSSDTGVVQALYRQLLGRDPAADTAGVAFWVGEAQRSGRVDVALNFFQSEEKRRGRVRDLYCTLLNRTPDAGGSAYWAGVILTQGDLALARNLATSAEYLASSDEFALGQVPTSPACAPTP
jgi:hypothetical protein